MIAPDGTEYPTTGVYREITPPERLVFTWGSPGDDDDAAPVISIDLAAHGDAGEQTLMTFHVQGIDGHPGDENVYDGWDSGVRHPRRAPAGAAALSRTPGVSNAGLARHRALSQDKTWQGKRGIAFSVRTAIGILSTCTVPRGTWDPIPASRTVSVRDVGHPGLMSDTTTRALSLLNLLQTHRHWPGSELAGRLGVTERTVRRDVERLRDLGYRIESSPGATGGYRLEAGSAVPPLLLTDEEAVAMAIGLRVAASQRLVSGPETTLTALAKLEQVLPAPLRRRVNALAEACSPPASRRAPRCRATCSASSPSRAATSERVRFTYTAASGEITRRRVEPHALAPADRHWYLLCWDLERDDWRTFRVDRLSDVEHTRALFAPHPLTAEQIEEFILVARSWVRQAVEADVVMDLPLDEMRECVRAVGPGRRCRRGRPHALAGRRRGFPRDDVRALVDPRGRRVHDRPRRTRARAELREALERMLRALDAPPPPSRHQSETATDAVPRSASVRSTA